MNVRRGAPLIALAITSCATFTTAAFEPVPPADQSQRCAEEYTPAATGQRAFAFDGEVTEIGNDPAPAHASSHRRVTFAVNEWFAGKGGERVTVEMMAPSAVTSIDNVAFEVGARLLVSGEGRWDGEGLGSPVAWSCGFTRLHTAEEASLWRAASDEASRSVHGSLATLLGLASGGRPAVEPSTR